MTLRDTDVAPSAERHVQPSGMVGSRSFGVTLPLGPNPNSWASDAFISSHGGMPEASRGSAIPEGLPVEDEGSPPSFGESPPTAQPDTSTTEAAVTTKDRITGEFNNCIPYARPTRSASTVALSSAILYSSSVERYESIFSFSFLTISAAAPCKEESAPPARSRNRSRAVAVVASFAVNSPGMAVREFCASASAFSRASSSSRIAASSASGSILNPVMLPPLACPRVS